MVLVYHNAKATPLPFIGGRGGNGKAADSNSNERSKDMTEDEQTFFCGKLGIDGFDGPSP